MRIAAFALALAALPFATPSFATSAASVECDVEVCNVIADQHGVTGYARSSFVQKCLERESAHYPAPAERAHPAG